MSQTQEKLRRMANQIAVNFAARGQEEAIEGTAEHIWKFWDPRMKAGIFADDPSHLNPIARAAIERLRRGEEDQEQAVADEFNSVGETGHCDAG